MDISTSFAARAYDSARPATRPEPLGDSPTGSLGATAQDFADTLRAGEATALEGLAGRADPHALVQALAETELAVEAAVTVRDRIVEAYQEILRMPV
ncbi:flagellar hook-basal body complex protein FliE [Rhodovulum iodosum]|uniref:Flagellar hook-basal body complex protein FliE n=1 Tax=Rhodovulum iodosum TaxID=68291 RepID=A0ABV3XRH6_9RHOB|nr:flagellar hook-basal body complex protein FliE [Rhodovulum robiginosum]RSK40020.1 flagellar hook-basal body complex protein FliE [Rhodovulum robiginosum]